MAAYTIRTIWAIAKSAQLHMDDTDLYAVISRETGKEHMRELTPAEINRVGRVLAEMRGPDAPKPHKGNRAADELRGKVYALSYTLGWGGSKTRINGLVRRMFGVETLEWLTPGQCSKLVEAMRAMAKRKEADADVAAVRDSFSGRGAGRPAGRAGAADDNQNDAGADTQPGGADDCGRIGR